MNLSAMNENTAWLLTEKKENYVFPNVCIPPSLSMKTMHGVVAGK